VPESFDSWSVWPIYLEFEEKRGFSYWGDGGGAEDVLAFDGECIVVGATLARVHSWLAANVDRIPVGARPGYESLARDITAGDETEPRLTVRFPEVYRRLRAGLANLGSEEASA
jgi:hypothetical protein